MNDLEKIQFHHGNNFEIRIVQTDIDQFECRVFDLVTQKAAIDPIIFPEDKYKDFKVRQFEELKEICIEELDKKIQARAA